MVNPVVLKKFADFASKNSKIKSKQSKSSKTKVSNILRPKTKINDGKKYKKQFDELKKINSNNKRLKVLTKWAVNFFDDEPDIAKVAKALSKKVDSALIAVNHPREKYKGLNLLDFTNADEIFFLKNAWSFRTKIDKKTIKFKKSPASSIKYRIPAPLASSLVSTARIGGKCEEHAFLSLYLLTIGQMIQNMPHGQLKNDIFFTGAATNGHAMTLLVKGKEFKDAILTAKRKAGRVAGDREIIRILRWMVFNTDKWGKNAWIVDGWDQKNVKQLGVRSKKLIPDYIKTQSFKRDTKHGFISKYDFTIRQMIYRVAKKYGIDVSDKP